MSGKPSIEGIDVRKALDILSQRSSDKAVNSMISPDKGCGCHKPHAGASMGQTIDLNAPSKRSNKEKSPGGEDAEGFAEINEELEKRQQRLAESRKTRAKEIRSRMESMSVSELIGAVMEAQSGRVAAYRDYEKGLDEVLQTGNISQYPEVCTKATASFAVLSDTVNAIRSVLEEKHKCLDVSSHIKTLQKHEQENLNLTAALHLEKLRQKNTEMQLAKDERAARLLKDGVDSLRQKVMDCKESINECLEEMRSILLEVEEENR